MTPSNHRQGRSNSREEEEFRKDWQHNETTTTVLSSATILNEFLSCFVSKEGGIILTSHGHCTRAVASLKKKRSSLWHIYMLYVSTK